MKHSKKFLIWLLIASLAVSICGCGRRSGSEGTSSGSSRDARKQSEQLSARGSANSDEPRSSRENSTQGNSSRENSSRENSSRDTAPSEPTQPTRQQTANAATDESGHKIYTDNRLANYTGQNPQWETIHFQWNSATTGSVMEMELPVDRSMYQHYKSLERFYYPKDYHYYVEDANNFELVSGIVEAMRGAAQQNSYSEGSVVRELAKFVQQAIPYETDPVSTGQTDYPKYPIETLYEGCGDCEDSSILMAALLKAYGYEVGFIHVPGHIAVALRTADNYAEGAYYELDGHRYLYIESTAEGWNIGNIPEDISNESAAIYLLP